MKIMKALPIMMAASLMAVSCASWHETRSDARVVELRHIRGDRNTCLANCVDMVLNYYGVGMLFAQQPGVPAPANLLAMDSLIHTMSSQSPADPYAIHSFVLQGDEKFLQDQLVHQRPVILIYVSGKNMYHSVVVTGYTASHRAYFVDDPAQRKGQWISRGKLLRRWKTTGNTALLVALAPAGT